MKSNRRLNSQFLALVFLILFICLMSSTAMAAAGQWGIVHAKFTVSPTIGNAPLKVHIYDRTTFGNGGKVANRFWDFGDGTTLVWDGKGPSSLTRNPIHTYRSPGKYKVTLIEGVIFKNGNYNDNTSSKVIKVLKK
jgi:PKD repeat protein